METCGAKKAREIVLAKNCTIVSASEFEKPFTIAG